MLRARRLAIKLQPRPPAPALEFAARFDRLSARCSHCNAQWAMHNGTDGAMGRLTTHVLDTARGCPAAGLEIDLRRLTGDEPLSLGRYVTNRDGRVDGPLLEGAALQTGRYELLFLAGAYFASHDLPLPSGQFLDEIPIRFHIADSAAHYHVPLLLSPYAYSTYRGS